MISAKGIVMIIVCAAAALGVAVTFSVRGTTTNNEGENTANTSALENSTIEVLQESQEAFVAVMESACASDNIPENSCVKALCPLFDDDSVSTDFDSTLACPFSDREFTLNQMLDDAHLANLKESGCFGGMFGSKKPAVGEDDVACYRKCADGCRGGDRALFCACTADCSEVSCGMSNAAEIKMQCNLMSMCAEGCKIDCARQVDGGGCSCAEECVVEKCGAAESSVEALVSCEPPTDVPDLDPAKCVTDCKTECENNDDVKQMCKCSSFCFKDKCELSPENVIELNEECYMAGERTDSGCIKACATSCQDDKEPCSCDSKCFEESCGFAADVVAELVDQCDQPVEQVLGDDCTAMCQTTCAGDADLCACTGACAKDTCLEPDSVVAEIRLQCENAFSTSNDVEAPACIRDCAQECTNDCSCAASCDSSTCDEDERRAIENFQGRCRRRRLASLLKTQGARKESAGETSELALDLAHEAKFMDDEAGLELRKLWWHGHWPHRHRPHRHRPHFHLPHLHWPHGHWPHHHNPHLHWPHHHNPHHHCPHQHDPHCHWPHTHGPKDYLKKMESTSKGENGVVWKGYDMNLKISDGITTRFGYNDNNVLQDAWNAVTQFATNIVGGAFITAANWVIGLFSTNDCFLDYPPEPPEMEMKAWTRIRNAGYLDESLPVGYPLIFDAATPTFIQRKIKDGVGPLSEVTWVYENVKSAHNRRAEHWGRKRNDQTLPVQVACDTDPNKQCVQVEFHQHLHGGFHQKFHYAGTNTRGGGNNAGSRDAEYGWFHNSWAANQYSTVAGTKAAIGSAEKTHFLKSSEPEVIFPEQPQFNTLWGDNDSPMKTVAQAAKLVSSATGWVNDALQVVTMETFPSVDFNLDICPSVLDLAKMLVWMLKAGIWAMVIANIAGHVQNIASMWQSTGTGMDLLDKGNLKGAAQKFLESRDIATKMSGPVGEASRSSQWLGKAANFAQQGNIEMAKHWGQMAVDTGILKGSAGITLTAMGGLGSGGLFALAKDWASGQIKKHFLGKVFLDVLEHDDLAQYQPLERMLNIIVYADLSKAGKQFYEATKDNFLHDYSYESHDKLNDHPLRQSVMDKKWSRAALGGARSALSSAEFDNWSSSKLKNYKSEVNCLHYGEGKHVTTKSQRCIMWPDGEEEVIAEEEIVGDKSTWTSINEIKCPKESLPTPENDAGWPIYEGLKGAVAGLAAGAAGGAATGATMGALGGLSFPGAGSAAGAGAGAIAGAIGGGLWGLGAGFYAGLLLSAQQSPDGYCGYPCGYYQLPLDHEVMSYRASASFDQTKIRTISYQIGTSMARFDNDQLVVYFEAAQHFVMNEEAQQIGPPKYMGEFYVGQPSPMYFPESMGGFESYSIPTTDGRGGMAHMLHDDELIGRHAGHAILPRMAMDKWLTRMAMARHYHNLYPGLGPKKWGFGEKGLFGGFMATEQRSVEDGCGMPVRTFDNNEGKQYWWITNAQDLIPFASDDEDETEAYLYTKDAWGDPHPVCRDQAMFKQICARADNVSACEEWLLETGKFGEEFKNEDESSRATFLMGFNGKTSKVFREFRQSYQRTNGNIDPMEKVWTSTNSLLGTMQCATQFVRSNHPNSHGLDLLETVVWGHQLSEYNYDLDLSLLVSHDYWNTPPAFAEPCNRPGADLEALDCERGGKSHV